MQEKTISYELDFGYTILNALNKKTFILTNTSSFHHYKFKIVTTSNLIIIPQVGHLKSLSSKEILATFTVKEPIQIIKVRIGSAKFGLYIQLFHF